MKTRNAAVIVVLLLLFLFTGCTGDENKKGAFIARDQKYYDILGISHEPSPREDGMHTSGKEKTYEWWYFDSEYADGTKIVAVFFTKFRFDLKGPAQPTVNIDITLPDGRKITKEVSEEKGSSIRASRDKCDVQIGDSTVRYKDGNYELHVAIDDVNFDSVMKPRAPMWRPGTGYICFGGDSGTPIDKYIAWFIAVPAADVESKLTVGNEVKTLKGTGYHDHNWGNEEMNKLMSHWYWARVAFDDYTLILVDIVAEKKYGYTRVPLFMLAQNGKLIDDNEETVKIVRADTIEHPVTKKFMDNTLTFTQKTSDGTTYQIELKRKEDVLNFDLLETVGLSRFMIRLAKLLGENPTYTRVAGDAIMTITDKENKQKKLKTTAIWEQMSFSKNKDAIVHDYR